MNYLDHAFELPGGELVLLAAPFSYEADTAALDGKLQKYYATISGDSEAG
jgi:hypothetical protein